LDTSPPGLRVAGGELEQVAKEELANYSRRFSVCNAANLRSDPFNDLQ
jgi:hypothetical protein